MTQWGLDALFNPAKRHMDEEKRRLQSTRSEIGDSSGGKRIDLESGKVVIAKAGEDDEADQPVPADASSKVASAKGSGAPSPAAARAARRRAKISPPGRSGS